MILSVKIWLNEYIWYLCNLINRNHVTRSDQTFLALLHYQGIIYLTFQLLLNHVIRAVHAKSIPMLAHADYITCIYLNYRHYWNTFKPTSIQDMLSEYAATSKSWGYCNAFKLLLQNMVLFRITTRITGKKINLKIYLFFLNWKFEKIKN